MIKTSNIHPCRTLLHRQRVISLRFAVYYSADKPFLKLIKGRHCLHLPSLCYTSLLRGHSEKALKASPSTMSRNVKSPQRIILQYPLYTPAFRKWNSYVTVNGPYKRNKLETTPLPENNSLRLIFKFTEQKEPNLREPWPWITEDSSQWTHICTLIICEHFLSPTEVCI